MLEIKKVLNYIFQSVSNEVFDMNNNEIEENNSSACEIDSDEDDEENISLEELKERLKNQKPIIQDFFDE